MQSALRHPCSATLLAELLVSHCFPSVSRHRSFKGATVGKAALMSMCGRKSGGVVRVRLGTILLHSFKFALSPEWRFCCQNLH